MCRRKLSLFGLQCVVVENGESVFPSNWSLVDARLASHFQLFFAKTGDFSFHLVHLIPELAVFVEESLSSVGDRNAGDTHLDKVVLEDERALPIFKDGAWLVDGAAERSGVEDSRLAGHGVCVCVERVGIECNGVEQTASAKRGTIAIDGLVYDTRPKS
jgi:hypothetical protein